MCNIATNLVVLALVGHYSFHSGGDESPGPDIARI